jgi:hypothetical protein
VCITPAFEAQGWVIFRFSRDDLNSVDFLLINFFVSNDLLAFHIYHYETLAIAFTKAVAILVGFKYRDLLITEAFKVNDNILICNSCFYATGTGERLRVGGGAKACEIHNKPYDHRS